MKITLDVSDKNESTDAPWWIIIDPNKNFNKSNVDLFAGCIDGPYFSRQEAQDYLNGHLYNYSKKAVVYCMSAYRARQYREAYREARNNIEDKI